MAEWFTEICAGGIISAVKGRIAQNLKELRKRRGLTQSELAEVSGVEQSAISKYERGTVPDLPGLLRLAIGLQATMDELVAGENPDYHSFQRSPDVAAETRALEELADTYYGFLNEITAGLEGVTEVVHRAKSDPLGQGIAGGRKAHRRRRRP